MGVELGVAHEEAPGSPLEGRQGAFGGQQGRALGLKEPMHPGKAGAELRQVVLGQHRLAAQANRAGRRRPGHGAPDPPHAIGVEGLPAPGRQPAFPPARVPQAAGIVRHPLRGKAPERQHGRAQHRIGKIAPAHQGHGRIQQGREMGRVQFRLHQGFQIDEHRLVATGDEVFPVDVAAVQGVHQAQQLAGPVIEASHRFGVGAGRPGHLLHPAVARPFDHAGQAQRPRVAPGVDPGQQAGESPEQAQVLGMMVDRQPPGEGQPSHAAAAPMGVG